MRDPARIRSRFRIRVRSKAPLDPSVGTRTVGETMRTSESTTFGRKTLRKLRSHCPLLVPMRSPRSSKVRSTYRLASTEPNASTSTAPSTGHRAHFIFDTGTTQILIDGAAAKALGSETISDMGLQVELIDGTGSFQEPCHRNDVARSFPSRRHPRVPDYSAGHIVHLDYAHGRLSFARRDTFSAPANASEMGIDYREGMPLATAAVGPVRSSRIVLDTGSQTPSFCGRFFRHRRRRRRNSDSVCLGRPPESDFSKVRSSSKTQRCRSCVSPANRFATAPCSWKYKVPRKRSTFRSTAFSERKSSTSSNGGSITTAAAVGCFTPNSVVDGTSD